MGSPVDDALDRHRSEADYIDRTIATVRNFREADNCWPQWANIFADEIEDLRAEVRRLKGTPPLARITELEAINAQLARQVRRLTEGLRYLDELAQAWIAADTPADRPECPQCGGRGTESRSWDEPERCPGCRGTGLAPADSGRGDLDGWIDKARALLAASPHGGNTEGGEA